MTRSADPEREIVRRVAPFGPPVAVLAFFVGAAAGGWRVGASAAIGIAIVLANAVANGLLLARAARVSLVAYSVAVMGGFVVRLGVILALMFLLNRYDWFSPLAFGLAVVPATVAMLVYEMRLVARGLGQELRLADPASREEARR
ncbi:MAG TPA: hypothetical protein VF972_01780 [Actinomycetota bacterium]